MTSPGRLEIVKRTPTVILDAAHNPHGAQSLVAALQDEFGFDRLVFVLGMFADKDYRGFLELIEPLADHLICTQSSSPRALPAVELAAAAVQAGFEPVEVAPKLIDAIDRAVAIADEVAADESSAGLVICGSIVTIAEARALLGRHSA